MPEAIARRKFQPAVAMGYDAEFWRWDEDVREIYEERVSIMADGGAVTPAIDRIARQEARKAQAGKVAQAASNGAVSFGFGR